MYNWEKENNATVNLFTVGKDFMDETGYRLRKMEKQMKRCRRATGLLLVIAIGLGWDIWALREETKKNKKKDNEEDKRDE